MRALLKFAKKIYRDTLHSIAFYPVLISFGYLVLAVISVSAEKYEIISALKKKVPYLFIEDFETARTILATLFGGILSLTVFSFTMVMVVLGQASSNFSPGLLPGLISNRKHQVILGIYIGTLIYVIIVLISLGAYGLDSRSLGLSTMLAALLGVICIGLFVYFIHSISGAIQIQNITARIFSESSSHLKKVISKLEDANVLMKIDDSQPWETIRIDRTGYYRGFDQSLLINTFQEKKHHIEILPFPGQHLWEGDPVLKIKETISVEERKSLLFGLHISSDRHDNSAIGGMIKLMEVAVKALSPGINDPGTAIDAIGKIGRLMKKMLEINSKSIVAIKEPDIVLIENHILGRELMRSIIQPIRHYSENDMAVQFELISSLQFILRDPNITRRNRTAIEEELLHIKQSLEGSAPERDKKRVLELLDN